MSQDANITAARLGPQDLAELFGAFNEATSKLQSAHEALRAEVSRLEGELRQANERLERSRRLAALGEMAAGIAHEVRNPLGSIGLYARLLMQDLTDRPGERGVAEKIAGAVRGLDAVVCDVLSFAREMTPRTEPCDLSALLDDAIEESLAGLAPESAAAMRSPIRIVRLDRATSESGVPRCREVECDPTLVRRALVNIVKNAVQAMHGEDAPAPCDEREAVLAVDVQSGSNTGGARGAGSGRSEPEGEAVTVIIRDTGPGLSADVMRRMFNPFFTTRAAGTGLGLAMVHRIVDAHGGRIVVRNARVNDTGGEVCRGGAVVEIVLPCRSAVGGAVLPNEEGREGQKAVVVRVGSTRRRPRAKPDLVSANVAQGAAGTGDSGARGKVEVTEDAE